MRRTNLFITLASVFVFILIGCSGIEHPMLSENSDVSRKQTIIVMGINWVELSNDTTQKPEEDMLQYSSELLDNGPLVSENLVSKDQTELYHPLYHLSAFKFSFYKSRKRGASVLPVLGKIYDNMKKSLPIAFFRDNTSSTIYQ